MILPKVPAVGPKTADILIVGEAPGKEEVARSIPFVGASGMELTNMLHEAGFVRADCFITNVCKYRPTGNEIERFLNIKKYRPPEAPIGVDAIGLVRGKAVAWPVVQGIQELEQEIKEVQPKIIIALGNTALWALTGEYGITSWRGSVLETDKLRNSEGQPFKVLPTYHPSMIVRRWEWRHIGVFDLRRAKKILAGEYGRKERTYHIKPSYPEVMAQLGKLLLQVERGEELPLLVDIETIPSMQHITEIGIAWSSSEGMCIPFMDVRKEDLCYFDEDEELQIVLRLRKLLTHPKVQVMGHNYLYDDQYIARNWGFTCNVFLDTMLAHHVCFPGMEKSLAFCASLYCDDYTYWKEERKNTKMTWDEQEANWIYNCKDVVHNFEVAECLLQTIQGFGLMDRLKDQMELYPAVLEMMLFGARIDNAAKAKVVEELLERIYEHEMWVYKMLDEPLNPRSPKQMQKLFYEDFGQKRVLNRKTRRPTTDDDALKEIARREPLLAPLCARINEIRSLQTLASSLSGGKKQRMVLDHDQRMRCSYNIAGTETFRFNSSIDVFGFGMNLQNITSGKEEGAGDFEKPNLRKLFIPDPGYIFFDIDLDRADAQVVAWDADDEELMQMFREGVDIHTENAKSIYGKCTPELRQRAKAGVHATNYFCKAKTLAIALGCTVAEAEYFQYRWFSAHPKIAKWHERIEQELMRTRTVWNAFGYRRRYFERVDNLLPEALAWIPQSTVANVINRGIVQVHKKIEKHLAQVLLQVHDSAAGQVRISHANQIFPKLKECFLIEIPYPKPLIIPVGLKTSQISWGHCKEADWNNPLGQ